MTSDLDLFTKGRGFPFEHISPSFISKYETCPLAALYYREGRPKVWDPRYAEQGRWTHSVLEQKYNPNAEIYTPACGIDSEMRTRHNMSIKGFDELMKQDQRFIPVTEAKPRSRQHPEVHVHMEIAGVPLIGYIDLLTIRGHTIYIDDWKTGLYKAADEQQIRIYTRMVSSIMGISPRDIIATLDYLRSEPKKIQHRVGFTSVKSIDHHIIEDVIKPICDLQFIPHRGNACGRCEYRHLCEAW